AILHESGLVAYQYLRVENGRNTLVSGKSATIGVEDGSVMFAAKYTFNGNPALVSNSQALVLKPAGAGASQPTLAAPTLSSVGLSCTLIAAPGQQCVIESSTTLVSWTAAETNTVPASGEMKFSEAAGSGL